MPLKQTAIVRLVQRFLERSERLGIGRSEMMQAVGLTEYDIRDPDARVPVLKLLDLWRFLIANDSDPALGIRLGQTADIRGLGLVGYALMHSNTLRQALDRLVRYCHILSEAVQFHLVENGTEAAVVIEKDERFEALRYPVDARLALVLSMSREITGRPIIPLQVDFPYARPEDSAIHRQFFQASIKYNQPISRMVFRQSDFDLPVVSADETLAGYLDKLADDVLKALDDGKSVSDQVRRALWDELSAGTPSVSRVAERLRIGVRTLQRRLREEAATFADILDRLRQDMAIHLLEDRNLAVYEVAFLLGYAEPSTFYRAFRRWEGRSPLAHRRWGRADN